jgi:hypothetical protein
VAEVRFPSGVEISLFIASRLAGGSDHETSHLPPSIAEVKNAWNYAFTPHTSL